MENNTNVVEKNGKINKTKSYKTRLLFLFFLVLIAVGTYGYFWFAKTKVMRMQAEQVIQRSKMFDDLGTAIIDEQNRCKELITQKEGDFASFEYCKKFLVWSTGAFSGAL